MNSIDAILVDKVLMKTQLGLQKRFQMFGGPSLRLGIPEERLSFPSSTG